MSSNRRLASRTNCRLILISVFVFAIFASVSYSQGLNELRLKPSEATGGTNLYSRNFGWSNSLVGLPGRSGLDAGFGISYNSLVWIKAAATSEIIFNPDAGKPGPGFKFGYSTIEYPYYDSTNSRYAFMMVEADGSRTEFRQIGSTDYFEPGDSSYRGLKINTGAQLDGKAADIDVTVTNTDGTQMHYLWKSGFYRLHEIKDRNGNYVEMEYSSTGGRLTKVIDTLGREINVAYDGGGYPTTVTQTWKANNGEGTGTATHYWAQFEYTNVTVSTNFAGLTVVGPANSTTLKSLEKITYADGSSTKFEYNGYVQVKKITNIAADTTTNLNYVETNLADVSGAQSDVPRLTETRNWAKDFNGGTAVVVKNTLDASQTYSLGSASGTATRIQVYVEGHPNDLRSNTFVYASGWNEGLPIGTEDCVTTTTTCSTQKRWTWKQWTQDNTGVSYILNPRVTESKVGDGTNTKRTTVGYGSNGYGLPEEVKVYETDGTTVLKTQITEYNLSSNYTDRRIIGLASESRLYQGTSSSGTLMSKVTFAYDENGYTDSSQNVSTPTKHASGYGTGFNYRGNQTSVKRWDVTDSNNSSLTSKSSVVYNIVGSPVKQKDARDREVTISYTDDWNDNVTRYTYAYPTKIIDPNGNATTNSSTVEYRFDTGANVWARSPTPAGSGNTNGKTTSREYNDTTGRLTKSKIDTTGAYSRYEYATNGTDITSYATIIDVDGDTNLGEDEVATLMQLDGAGRVRRTRTENPNSTGGYTGKKVEYDLIGRAFRETVPTEMDGSWNPAGDDYRSNTWLWNTSEFDWKGRTTRTIPSDSNGSDGKDTLISYAGCGCAGGMITTIQGPVTTAIDVAGNTQTTKRRTQAIYADILGRTAKTEIWDLDGAGTYPYSTTVNTYNGRDQVTNVRQLSGGTSSSTYQDTAMSYDGHGRPYQVHKPEFDASTYVTTTYNVDDTVATVTDPRGVSTNYSYGNPSIGEKRAVVTDITYSVGSTGIVDPADVAFTYDNAGNRTLMSDGTGTLTYTYDEMSRLKTETKDFTDYLANAPSGVYTLTYNYHLTGGIQSITDPFNDEVTYTADKIGRTTTIGGSSFAGFTTYASDIAYRAFGNVKSMTYNTTDATNITMSYDTALRPTAYVATSEANATDIHDKAYQYYNDGSVLRAQNADDGKFTQTNEYDFAGRLKTNTFGEYGTSHPYMQTLAYDAFSNISERKTWDKNSVERSFTAGYTNNRKSSGGYGSGTDTFDAAGNVVQNHFYDGANNDRYWTFDAAGRMTDWLESLPYLVPGHYWDAGEAITFDGDGRSAKRVKRHRHRVYGTEGYVLQYEYKIISSVTGQTITELTETGAKLKTSIYMGGSAIASQHEWEETQAVSFTNTDPLTGSTQETSSAGEMPAYDTGHNEFEPLGALANPSEEEMTVPNYGKGGSIKNPDTGCQLDYAPVSCSLAFRVLQSGGKYDILVDVRAEGGWALLHSLQSQIYATYSRTWKDKSGRKAPKSPNDSGDGSPESPITSHTQIDGGTWVYSYTITVVGNVSLRLDNRNDLPSWVKDIYRNPKLAKNLTDCINKVFNSRTVSVTKNGKTYDVLGGSRLPGQKIANAPYVDESSYDGIRLGHGTGKRAFGLTSSGNINDYATAEKNGFIPGEIYIANDITEKTVNGKTFSAYEIRQKAYVHELGNALSFMLTGDGEYFGDPNGIPSAANPAAPGDKDTGAALEKCVYNTPQLIP